MTSIRNLLCIGYTFIFKGQHCTIIRLSSRSFEYSTGQRPTGNYMHYSFFKTTNHFKSRYLNKRGVGFRNNFPIFRPKTAVSPAGKNSL